MVLQTHPIPPASEPAPFASGAPRAIDPLLERYLGERHAPCPVCGYDLHRLRQDACPECGAHLVLQVGSDNLAIGPWVLAVISLALAIGFDGVVSLLLTVGVSINPPRGRGEFLRVFEVLGGFLLLAALCAAGVAWLVRRRRTVWNRIPRRKQWRLAWGVFAAVGLVHLVFGVTLALVL